MESDEDQMTRSMTPVSGSYSSPKVTRPKLPPFAGTGSRSLSPRAKTDPGRGEIKAIMEDIMNLKKTDWKTFSRSRTLPHPKGKSMSTNTSPNSTPRIGSPIPEKQIQEEARTQSLTRDRSRSLKLLTDRLKNKKGGAQTSSTETNSDSPTQGSNSSLNEPKKKPPPTAPKPKLSPNQETCSTPVLDEDEEAKDVVVFPRSVEFQPSGNKCEHWTPQSSSSPIFGHQNSPRRSPDRRSMERMYEQIPETPEPPEDIDEHEGIQSPVRGSGSSEESFRSAHEAQDELQREKTPDPDGIYALSPDLHEGAFLHEEKSAEDEGIGEGGEPSTPVVSTYIYHPIPRNSKFLQLAATKPPKRFPPERRSGITMLATRSRVGSMNKDDSRSSTDRDVSPRQQRLPRRSDSGKSSAPKSPRFVTHPPGVKTSHSEAGSVDTNGFAALKTSTDSESDNKQHSQVSLADSQFASELSDEPTYQDGVESVESSEVSDRKNVKSAKQKSKSDPSGDRARELLEFPQALENPQSQSAPLLSKEELEAMGFEKGFVISEEEARQKSQSETLITSPSHPDDEFIDEHSSCGEEDDYLSTDTATPDGEHAMSPNSKSSNKSIIISPPGSSHSPPAAPSDRPSHLLSVPPSQGGSRKPNIFRSASSASVLVNRKPASGSVREKENARKFSITSDESISGSRSSVNLAADFVPIGDTNASSMPTVCIKDTGSVRHPSGTDSPEREPGFIKVGGFLYFLIKIINNRFQ